ncbi:MAG: endonuclease/exonuclease/phosphatase family protein, partial [Anaerolineales bacterium]|nr:endonuclease/exonuclease/phosphatase family protein [Anaerolineales bacterium]
RTGPQRRGGFSGDRRPHAVELGEEETAGGGEGMMRFPAEAVIAAEQTIIVAQTAVRFYQRYGLNPDYEIQDSDPAVPNMRRFVLLAEGDIGLANGGDEVILLDDKNGRVDVLNYGDSLTYFDPSIAAAPQGNSLERTYANCDTDTAADWQPQPQPNPYEITLSEQCAQATFAEDVPPIGAVQGTAEVSTAVNQRITVQGTVIGRHADTNADGMTFHTLYIQDAGDDDLATSDGLAIFFSRDEPDAAAGDQLQITGQLTEYFNLTEIADINLRVQFMGQNEELPQPIVLSNEQRPSEALEGMLVTIPSATVIGATYRTDAGCGFAVSLDGSTRLIQHTAVSDLSHIVPILWHDERHCDEMPAVKVGDVIHGLTGPLTYNFDQFRLIHQPDYELIIAAIPFPDPPQPPTLNNNQFSVASLNVENFFDSNDDTGTAAEPKLTAAQIDIKQNKLTHTVAHVLGCPTLVAIQEIEKAHLLAGLAEALTEPCGFTYKVSHQESFDVRGIDTALLSNPQLVTVQDVQLAQGCSPLATGLEGFDCPAGEEPLFSRPPLLVTLAINNQPLTVIVNHFKSKRGGDDETEPRRLLQAEHVASLVANQAHEAIVLGDFNDYADSRPLQMLTNSGLVNLLRQLPDAEQYSFVFSGASQLIDGILATPTLAGQATAVQIMHINADFPDALADELTPEFITFKSSDHDPALVVFTLPATEAVPTAAPPTAVPVLAASPAEVAPPAAASPIWHWGIFGLFIFSAAVLGVWWRH